MVAESLTNAWASSVFQFFSKAKLYSHCFTSLQNFHLFWQKFSSVDFSPQAKLLEGTLNDTHDIGGWYADIADGSTYR